MTKEKDNCAKYPTDNTNYKKSFISIMFIYPIYPAKKTQFLFIFHIINIFGFCLYF